jgi:uncharacterized protein YjcR
MMTGDGRNSFTRLLDEIHDAQRRRYNDAPDAATKLMVLIDIGEKLGVKPSQVLLWLRSTKPTTVADIRPRVTVTEEKKD